MKYKITNEKHPKFNIYRIQALKDFEDVSAGQVGGFIENESNLSQDGNCWVYDNASAFGSAKVFGDARIQQNARVSGSARVFGNAIITDYATICDNARVFDNAVVFGNAKISGNATIRDNARVENYASVGENAIIYGTAVVNFGAYIFGKMKITENAVLFSALGKRIIYDNGYVLVGCFYGTLDEFHRRIYTDGNYTDRTLPPHRKQYLGFIKMIERWEREKCI